MKFRCVCDVSGGAIIMRLNGAGFCECQTGQKYDNIEKWIVYNRVESKVCGIWAGLKGWKSCEGIVYNGVVLCDFAKGKEGNNSRRNVDEELKVGGHVL